ncbi:hypothetical protein [Streptomyces sp. NPDC057238]|uniref:hypothetical protein n=1 Tax=Streptomyces sp. NPDC057238 TaxID=3346060 RepID=UPI0036382ED8
MDASVPDPPDRPYITAETAHLEEEEQRRRIHEAQMATLQREKRREQIRARNAVTRALAEATAAQQDGRLDE